MIDALYIANTGLRSQQINLDVISNNVVNMNTAGFKKSRLSFVALTYRNATLPQVDKSDSKAGSLIGSGTGIASTRTIFSGGDVRQTQNPLDVAIRGNGFLEVVSADGELRYTRAGQLQLDSEGFLTVQDGSRLSAGIQIPADAEEIEIAANGAVRVRLSSETAPINIGNIELARFVNTSGLKPVGSGLFAATEESGASYYAQPGDVGVGGLMQGYLEMSNVDLTEEMTNLMLAQRAYQLNARLLQTADQILETINNMRR